MRKNDKYDYQILLKVHNLARNDNEVTIYGPYSLDNKNDVKSLEKLLEKDFLKIVDQDEELEKYSELVEIFISLLFLFLFLRYTECSHQLVIRELIFKIGKVDFLFFRGF